MLALRSFRIEPFGLDVSSPTYTHPRAFSRHVLRSQHLRYSAHMTFKIEVASTKIMHRSLTRTAGYVACCLRPPQHSVK
jgi:hypothetical protein